MTYLGINNKVQERWTLMNLKPHSGNLNNAVYVNKSNIFCGEMYQWEELIESIFKISL